MISEYMYFECVRLTFTYQLCFMTTFLDISACPAVICTSLSPEHHFKYCISDAQATYLLPSFLSLVSRIKDHQSLAAQLLEGSQVIKLASCPHT